MKNDQGKLKRWLCNRYLVCLFALMGLLSAFIANAVAEFEKVRRDETENEPYLTCEQFEVQTEGAKTVMTGRLDFLRGEYYMLRATVNNPTDQEQTVSVKILENDRAYDGYEFVVPAQDQYVIDERFAFGQTSHGDEGICRIAYPVESGLFVSEMQLYRGSMVDGSTAETMFARGACLTVAFFCGIIVLLSVLCMVKGIGWKALNEKVDAGFHSLSKAVRERRAYLIVFAVIVGALSFLYRKADLFRPMMFNEYTNDVHGVYYYINALKQGNMYGVDPYAGGFYGADQFAYPNFDIMYMVLIRFLGLYATGTYLITNMFYFLCFILNGMSAVYVCRKLKLGNASTVLVSVLFAFSPYAQQRYQHLGLMLYCSLPLAVLVAVHIACGDYEKDAETGKRKASLAQALLFSFFCALTGLYYTFFACILYAGAALVRVIGRRGPVRKAVGAGLLNIVTCVFGIMLEAIPYFLCTLVRHSDEGMAGRSSAGSEVYGLRLFRMLLPRPDHRLSFMRVLANYISDDANPLFRNIFANECVDATLGLIGTVGFLISLIWLVREKESQRQALALLNLIALLAAVSGGIGTVFGILVSPVIRAYSRMSIVILFICLLCFGMTLDEMIKNKSSILADVAGIVLVLAGIFDQTTDYEPAGLDHYEELRRLLSFMDYYMPENSSVYVLPYATYIGESGIDIATIETDQMHFSILASRNSGADIWNRHVASSSAGELHEYLVNSGYNVLFFDTGMVGETEPKDEMVDALKAEFGKVPFTTETQRYLCWIIE